MSILIPYRSVDRNMEPTKKKHTLPPFEHFPHLSQRRALSPSTLANNRSFVSRANRISHAQKNAYHEGMDQYGISYHKDSTISKPQRYEKFIIDIGFGSGNTLVHMAHEHPSYSYLGIETFRPGIGSLFVQALSQQITNIRVVHSDVVPVMFHMIEDGTVDRIQIFFPDPWQKTRYHKRRLLQARFLQLCITLLKPGGILWIVTDWEPYAAHISTLIEPFTRPHSSLYGMYITKSDELTQELEAQRMSTRFEEKGKKKGHMIFPFIYKTIHT